MFLQAAAEIRRLIEGQGGSIEGATVLEIGTGRRLTLPVILWLMGAEQVISVDLHRYVKRAIVEMDLRALLADADANGAGMMKEVRADRLEQVRALLCSNWDLETLCRLGKIRYAAPTDAGSLDLPATCVDYHISYTVFEHIPAPILQEILREACRVIRNPGMAIHFIDHSDHFAHSDLSISAINFLQFDDDEWARLADNRYMYMNRLRVDDYPALYRSANHEILNLESTRELVLLDVLASQSFRLARRFQTKSQEALTTMASWIVSRPRTTLRGGGYRFGDSF